MRPEGLTLLRDNLPACRLCVTWPLVSDAFDELPALDGRGDDHEDVLFEWAAVTSMDVDHVRRLAPMLWRNGICLEDGTVDPTAMAYVRREAARALSGGG